MGGGRGSVSRIELCQLRREEAIARAWVAWLWVGFGWGVVSPLWLHGGSAGRVAVGCGGGGGGGGGGGWSSGGQGGVARDCRCGVRGG